MSQGNAKVAARPRRSAWRATVAAVGLLGTTLVGGCAVSEGGLLELAAPPSTQADAALAALAKGRLSDAESWATRALEVNPNDPYALLVRGMLADRTGQRGVAREAYQRIMSLNTTARINPQPLNPASTPRPLMEIAGERLGMLPPDAVAPGMARVPGVSGPTLLNEVQATVAGTPLDRDAAWQIIANRFETLEMLLSDGLVTPDEQQARRSANLGALLPLTQPPPSAGLTRPAPRATAIATRLKDIASTYERGGMAARQHAEERRAILDALLPADPSERLRGSMRPSDRRQARQLALRLQDALRRNLITEEEYAAERNALAGDLTTLPGADDRPNAEVLPPPAAVVMGRQTATAPGNDALDGDGDGAGQGRDQGSPGPIPPGSGPRPLIPAATGPGATAGPATANADDPATQSFSGVTEAPNDGAGSAATSGARYVHLASYRGMDTARAGWNALSQRYSGLMRGMEPLYDPVTIAGKGDFIRLKAGPVQIPGGPARLCDQLRAAGQFCEPTNAVGS